jgi:multidrug transporter EmrE-like cation transporter
MKVADFSLLFFGVLLNAMAQLGLKAATQESGAIRLEWPGMWQSTSQVLAAPAFWAAMTAYGLSVIVWLIGLSRVPVSQAYPLLSLGYVINAVLAWWLFGETVNTLRILGIGVVIIGVVLIARS